jgi:hypothetical protein
MRGTKSASGVGCLILFALPFAGVGLFMTGLTVVTLSRSFSAQGWERVPCQIQSVQNRGSSDGDSSQTKAGYKYEFGGKTYTGDRVSFHGGGDNIGSFQHRVHHELQRHHKDGKPFMGYINPGNPEEAVLYPNPRWEMIAFYMMFGLVFGGAGFGLMIGGVWAGKKVKREEARKREMPGEPWRWKEEWASGEIKSSNKAGMIGILIFAGLWNLIAIPAGIFVIINEVMEGGDKGALFVLIFPGVGLLLILWAIRAVIQWRKFGTSILKMASVPGVTGGKLAGVVTTPVHVTPEDGFHLSLRCVRRTETGSGKHRRTHESIEWEDERTMSRELFPDDPTQSAVPILFAIPFDAKQTDESNSRNQVVWRLEVTARVPGVDYAATFEVPVFRTAESSTDFVLDESSIEPFVAERDPEEGLRQAGIVMTRRGAGATEFYVPPARAFGSAIGLTLFAVVWTAAVVFMIMKKAPILFPIVFGLFDVLILLGLVDVWFAANRVVVSHGGVSARGGLLALGREQSVDADQIESIRPVTNMQSGNQVFYSIKLYRRGGKGVTLGKYMRGRRQAESVIAVIRAALAGERPRRTRVSLFDSLRNK